MIKTIGKTIYNNDGVPYYCIKIVHNRLFLVEESKKYDYKECDRISISKEELEKEYFQSYSEFLNNQYRKRLYLYERKKEMNEYLKARYNFTEILHYTDINNLDSIFRDRKLMARYLLSDFYDSASHSIINLTDPNIMEDVRLFFNKKTPTLFRMQEPPSLEKEYYMGRPIALLFSTKILTEIELKAKCFIGGRANKETHTINFDRTLSDKFDLIFQKNFMSEKHTNYRNAEIAVKNSLSLDYLNRIKVMTIFDKIQVEKLLRINNLSNDYKVDVDINYFFNNSIYIKSVRVSKSENKLNFGVSFLGNEELILKQKAVLRCRYDKDGCICYEETEISLLKKINFSVEIFPSYQSISILMFNYESELWNKNDKIL